MRKKPRVSGAREERKEEMEDKTSEFRRFIFSGTEEDKQKLRLLVKEKDLSREDLIFILLTLKLNPNML